MKKHEQLAAAASVPVTAYFTGRYIAAPEAYDYIREDSAREDLTCAENLAAFTATEQTLPESCSASELEQHAQKPSIETSWALNEDRVLVRSTEEVQPFVKVDALVAHAKANLVEVKAGRNDFEQNFGFGSAIVISALMAAVAFKRRNSRGGGEASSETRQGTLQNLSRKLRNRMHGILNLNADQNLETHQTVSK